MFLQGRNLREKIIEVVGGPNARLAVAFWGEDAAKMLGLKGRKDFQIICDISMGGTNPIELRELGAPDNQSLFYAENFHAKVYLSDVGAVVTSANASNNGIGFGGDSAGLTEAGYFTENTGEITAWFETQRGGSKQVDKQALKACEETWNARKKAFERFNPNAPKMSFMEALFQEPERFWEVGFVLTNEVLSNKKKSKARNEATKARLKIPDDYQYLEVDGAEKFATFVNIDFDPNHHVKFLRLSKVYVSEDNVIIAKKLTIGEWRKSTHRIDWSQKKINGDKSLHTKVKILLKHAEEKDKWVFSATEIFHLFSGTK